MTKSRSAVHTQMPKMRVPTSTSAREMKPPFDAPHPMGNGGIPTHTMESLGEKPARTVSASFASAPPTGTQGRRGRFPMGGKR